MLLKKKKEKTAGEKNVLELLHVMPSFALNKLENDLGNKLITINDTAIKIRKKTHSFSIKLPNNKNYLKIHLLFFSHS